MLSPETGDAMLCALLLGVIAWGRGCVSSGVSPLGLVGGPEAEIVIVDLGAGVV